MSGKPMDQKVIGLLTPRERFWREIRRHAAHFTAERTAHAARMNLGSARTYLRALVKAGYVEIIERRVDHKPALFRQAGHVMPTTHYRLVLDVGNEAPRLNRHGEEVAQGSGTQAMWTTLRICDVLDYRELAAHASTPECAVPASAAKAYLRMLKAAGYLDVVVADVPGHAIARYRLKRSHNTGPKAPLVQRTRQVFDPNLGKVMFQEDPQRFIEQRDGLRAEGCA